MKKISMFIFALIIVVTFIACDKTPSIKATAKEKITVKSEVVEVYYFHGTRRCVTCIAVGEVSSNYIKTHYSDNPNIRFIEVNIDEDVPGVKELANKFMVSGSGLYVYNSGEIENITAVAFQNAISSPEKLENKLLELISKHI